MKANLKGFLQVTYNKTLWGLQNARMYFLKRHHKEYKQNFIFNIHSFYKS